MAPPRVISPTWGASFGAGTASRLGAQALAGLCFRLERLACGFAWSRPRVALGPLKSERRGWAGEEGPKRRGGCVPKGCQVLT